MGAVAYQVVYIQCGNARLYGELVQHITERHNCWLRPLSLLFSQPLNGQPEFLDLRDGPDIICSEDRKSTRLNSSHSQQSRMPSSA